MSGARRQQPENSSIWKTLGTFAVGAAVGAGVAAMAYFATEEERQANQPHQNLDRTPSTVSSDERDEKTDVGVLQLCEICFHQFEEIKAVGGQIMSTPCGHVFCRNCITRSLGRRLECPHCRTPVTANQLQRLYI